MELLSRRARRRQIQRVYLHGPSHHNRRLDPDPARKHDLDRSRRRCAYTFRPLHFRAETESEAGGERMSYGCLTASIFYSTELSAMLLALLIILVNINTKLHEHKLKYAHAVF